MHLLQKSFITVELLRSMLSYKGKGRTDRCTLRDEVLDIGGVVLAVCTHSCRRGPGKPKIYSQLYN